ncbi:MAG: ferredoxin:thioredoxin reductase [Nitrospirae bacterium]|nr:ferredoxin:thioredoxin reductase [Nitrospirota bacterium]
MTPDQLYPVLSKYAASQGLELNIDKDHVIGIIAGLLENETRYGYRSCPCRLASGTKEKDADIICPCTYRSDDIKEYGTCYCSLYVSADWNSITLKKADVPERRPEAMQF